jgi:DNA-binding transcriptional LysR family regulator
MKSFDWDDLRIFLAIYREGNLSSAARALKISQPTVGRRLANLEASLSARLFDRLPDGMLPTAAGSELVGLAEQMEKAAHSVLRRQPSLADAVQGSVRISVYEPINVFLTDHLRFIRRQLPEVELEISVAHIEANLSRREADLQIRECRPDTPGVVCRRLGELAFAIYASRDYVEQNPAALTEARYEACDWVGMDDEHLYFAGQKWLREKLGPRLPALRCNNGIVMYDAVCRHAGLAILPCFHGDANPGLTRVCAPLPEATVNHYLLVHQDLRNLPVVRAMMNVIVELYETRRGALAGKAVENSDAA